MQTTTVTTVLTTSLVGAILTACGAQATSEPPVRQTPDIVKQAESYVGDPWEKRFREQFWADQHIHDSWNRCHLGENAPRPRGC